MHNTLPYDIIKDILQQVDLKSVTGDHLLDRFLIKSCDKFNPRRLLNGFIRGNSIESLCLLFYEHRDRLYIIFDINLVINAIEYTLKKGQYKMTILLLCKFDRYCMERWKDIVRLCCIAMCHMKDSKSIIDLGKLLKYIVNRVRPREQCVNKFTLPIYILWNMLSHEHSNIIISYLMQHKLLSFLHKDFCKCEKIIYHIVCYNHVCLYHYLPDGDYKHGLDVLSFAICFSNQQMLNCILQNVKIRYYTIGFISYLANIVKMNNNIENLKNIVVDGKTLDEIVALARSKQTTRS